MGAVRFGVPERLVLWARDTFAIRAFVETGTNRAATTIWASRHFKNVVTIEGQQSLHKAALAAHGHLPGVEFLNGDSRQLLGPVLEKLAEPAVLWLDAHWCGEGTFGPTAECPLLEELAWVNHSRFDHVLLIDDARLFVAPPPAPHRYDQWPDLLQVARALSEGHSSRYAAVFEDVIAAVPAAARELLVDFIRSHTAPPEHFTPSSLGERLRRALRH